MVREKKGRTSITMTSNGGGGGSSPNSALGVLRNTVEHLSVNVEDLGHRFEDMSRNFSAEMRDIYTRLDQIGRPNWQSYASWGALFLAGAVAVFTVNSHFTDLRIRPIESTIVASSADTKDEFELARLETERVRVEARAAREELRGDLQTLRTEVFPKGVHEQRWQLYDHEISSLDGKIADVSKRLGDLYNPSDKLKELQTQIDALRAMLNGYRVLPPSAPG